MGENKRYDPEYQRKEADRERKALAEAMLREELIDKALSLKLLVDAKKLCRQLMRADFQPGRAQVSF